jgi:hypothetical protein
LNSAVEHLEAFSFEKSEDKKLYLYDVEDKERSGSELVEQLKKHCTDPEEAFANMQEKTNTMIDTYTQKVKENDTLSADERRAWLGNIECMRDYYLQYVTNESAYKCALNALADKIHRSHIEVISLPMVRNYGLVLSHLVDVLRDHRPPYDATLSIEVKDGKLFGTLDMNR